jgi:hypothetical protein
MQSSQLEFVATLRSVVGYLGELQEAPWWPSRFFAPGNGAFLSPSFPRTQMLAQCRGVTQAAARIHDERIGVGEVYHLFRLPEDVEQGIHTALHDPELGRRIAEHTTSRDSAASLLRETGGESSPDHVGPVRIGDIATLRQSGSWRLVAACYAVAFQGGSPVYPFLADRR